MSRKDMDSTRLPDWGRFDLIVAVCHSAYHDLQLTLLREFERIGVSSFETILKTHSPLIPRFSRILGFCYPELHSYFSSMLAHYQALKLAKDRAVEHVLVIEDTARLLRNVETLGRVVAALPDDYDFAKFEWIPNRYQNPGFYVKEIDRRIRATGDPNPLWISGNGLPTSGSSCVAYSRRGIERKIACMDRRFSENHAIAADGYDTAKEFEDGLSCYLSLPISAIKDPTVYLIGYGHRFDRFGDSSGYGDDYPKNITSDDSFTTRFDLKVGELVKAVSCGNRIRVAVVGEDMAPAADLFSEQPSVDAVCLVSSQPDSPEDSGRYRVFSLGSVRAGRELPSVDLVYISAGICGDSSLVSELRSVFPRTVTFAGSGYGVYGGNVRQSVHAIFGVPDQYMNSDMWVVFGDRNPKELRYWDFRTGRLGNRLYCLLQIHRLGNGNKYVVQDDSIYYQLEELGASSLIATSTNGRDDAAFSWGPQWFIGTNYSEDDVLTFVRDILLSSAAYKDAVDKYGHDDETVAVHIRCTDMLSSDRWDVFDRKRYLADASRKISDTGTREVKQRALIFSDDVAAVKRLYGDTLSSLFSAVDYVSPVNSVADLMRMSLHRKKILFNSTYSAWAGYIGESVFGDRHLVVSPALFYRSIHGNRSLIGMDTLALSRWNLIPVFLSGGTAYPK